MSDRRSAHLFGSLFSALAGDREEFTPEQLWSLMHEGDYDFSECQMNVGKSLLKLGLAWRCPNPGCEDRYKDKGVLNYGPRTGKHSSTRCYTCKTPRSSS